MDRLDAFVAASLLAAVIGVAEVGSRACPRFVGVVKRVDRSTFP